MLVTSISFSTTVLRRSSTSTCTFELTQIDIDACTHQPPSEDEMTVSARDSADCRRLAIAPILNSQFVVRNSLHPYWHYYSSPVPRHSSHQVANPPS
eukprot:scaffold49991_cov60-Attheya_sp.AAC.3